MNKKGRESYLKDINKTTKLVKENNADKVLSVEDAAKKLAMTMHGR